jgi:hypothetical protein
VSLCFVIFIGLWLMVMAPSSHILGGRQLQGVKLNVANLVRV